MPEYIISGIPVNFPFEPYKVQTDYMEKVIECIEEVKFIKFYFFYQNFNYFF